MNVKPAQSPLAPKTTPTLPRVAGVKLGAARSGVRYKDRDDVMLAVVPAGASHRGRADPLQDLVGAGRLVPQEPGARQGARHRRQCRQRQRLHRQGRRQGGRGEHARHRPGAGLPAQRSVHGLDRRDRPAARLGEDRRGRARPHQVGTRGRLGRRGRRDHDHRHLPQARHAPGQDRRADRDHQRLPQGLGHDRARHGDHAGASSSPTPRCRAACCRNCWPTPPTSR